MLLCWMAFTYLRTFFCIHPLFSEHRCFLADMCMGLSVSDHTDDRVTTAWHCGLFLISLMNRGTWSLFSSLWPLHIEQNQGGQFRICYILSSILFQ